MLPVSPGCPDCSSGVMVCHLQGVFVCQPWGTCLVMVRRVYAGPVMPPLSVCLRDWVGGEANFMSFGEALAISKRLLSRVPDSAAVLLPESFVGRYPFGVTVAVISPAAFMAE